MTREKDTRPADLDIRYEWCEGSVPPPYHYEYTIRVGPGLQGEVVFLPDYPQHNPPAWREEIAVDGPALDRLYALMLQQKLFGKRWRERPHPPVGGSLEWLEVSAGGKHVAVSRLMEGAEVLEEVMRAVRALVPEAIWTKLRAQREQYEQDYLARHGEDGL